MWYRFAWWRDRYVRAFAQHGDPHRDSPNVSQRHDGERAVKVHPYQFPLTQHNAWCDAKGLASHLLSSLERDHIGTLPVKQNRTTVKHELSLTNAASSPIGTMRSLLPLPITRTTPCCNSYSQWWVWPILLRVILWRTAIPTWLYRVTRAEFWHQAYLINLWLVARLNI